MPAFQTLIKATTLSAALLTLAACGGGSSSTANITNPSPPTVTPTQDPIQPTVSTPPPQPPASSGGTTTGGTTNSSADAPEISGEPVMAVRVGETYEFQPAATDPNGEALRFSITNLPSWAAFDANTGRLSGTPTDADVGSYASIRISAANADRSSSLSPFSITVTQISTGSATVSWQSPIKNTDGSTLKDLKGFRIHYGRSASQLNQSVKISNASISRYVVDNLSAGAWYFAVSALNSRGIQSDLSGVRSKVIN